MASTAPLVACFGATGGCTLAALVPALKAGYGCTALVRTPTKLFNMLLEKGVTQSEIDANLTITQGDVLNVEDCRNVLTRNGRTVDIIISGVGTLPTFSQMTICANAVKNILSALRTLRPTKKPLFVAISSTGITTTGPRDVPLLMAPLYYVLLANPHKDKKNMEDAIIEHAESTESATSGYVLIRPTLLTNGNAQGGQKVKVGTDAKPEIGYTIRRNDVGRWMFENLLQSDGSKYSGQKLSFTY